MKDCMITIRMQGRHQAQAGTKIGYVSQSSWWLKHFVENPERQHNEPRYQFQHTVDRDAHNPERQQYQPHQREKYYREQRNRPTENEKYAPQQESEHVRGYPT